MCLEYIPSIKTGKFLGFLCKVLRQQPRDCQYQFCLPTFLTSTMWGGRATGRLKLCGGKGIANMRMVKVKTRNVKVNMQAKKEIFLTSTKWWGPRAMARIKLCRKGIANMQMVQVKTGKVKKERENKNCFDLNYVGSPGPWPGWNCVGKVRIASMHTGTLWFSPTRISEWKLPQRDLTWNGIKIFWLFEQP